MLSRTLIASLLGGSLALGTTVHASAQEPPPPAPQPPPPAQTPPPSYYPTPLAQTTQPSYVPQSVALSGPEELTEWNEGDPIPPGYHPVERVRKGLIIGGAATFGSLYLLSAFAGSVGQDASNGGTNDEAALYVPAIGPFIEMTKSSTATGNFFLIVDGLAQTAGLTMLVYGLTVPRTILVRNDLAKSSAPTFAVTPMLAKGLTGLGAMGTF